MTRSHAVHREEKTVADPLATYLEDHIAGASYAIDLLGAIRDQRDGGAAG